MVRRRRGALTAYCPLATGDSDSGVPARSSPAAGERDRLDLEPAGGRSHGDRRVRVPHLSCAQLVAAPTGVGTRGVSSSSRCAWSGSSLSRSGLSRGCLRVLAVNALRDRHRGVGHLLRVGSPVRRTGVHASERCNAGPTWPHSQRIAMPDRSRRAIRQHARIAHDRHHRLHDRLRPHLHPPQPSIQRARGTRRLRRNLTRQLLHPPCRRNKSPAR